MRRIQKKVSEKGLLKRSLKNEIKIKKQKVKDWKQKWSNFFAYCERVSKH